MELDEVPAKQHLAYFLGEIVIRDSFAEHEARVLWRVLNDVGIATGKRPEMFGRLLPALELLFQDARVPDSLRAIAAPLLARARRWHKYRTDLVHDLLTTGWGRNGDVQSALGKHPSRPIAEMKECSDQLQQVSYSLRGLYVIAPYWILGMGDSWDDPDGLRSWTRVAMGEIADVPSEIRGTAGPSPEPPGGWEKMLAIAVAARELEDQRLDGDFRIVIGDDED